MAVAASTLRIVAESGFVFDQASVGMLAFCLAWLVMGRLLIGGPKYWTIVFWLVIPAIIIADLPYQSGLFKNVMSEKAAMYESSSYAAIFPEKVNFAEPFQNLSTSILQWPIVKVAMSVVSPKSEL